MSRRKNKNDAAFYIVVTFPALFGAFVLYAKDHAAIIEEERKASEEKGGNEL